MGSETIQSNENKSETHECQCEQISPSQLAEEERLYKNIEHLFYNGSKVPKCLCREYLRFTGVHYNISSCGVLQEALNYPTRMLPRREHISRENFKEALQVVCWTLSSLVRSTTCGCGLSCECEEECFREIGCECRYECECGCGCFCHCDKVCNECKGDCESESDSEYSSDESESEN